ncbi:hypothetical protein P154DRAFT_558485 [Amniculicola lignicola CBS 123094]|uniref:BTB domain-containing protein n=1 Tax=Amniculicola lignicola CBS 123094 TaxID=1392246 RepID=A0A6A5X5N1_9PLEO|nr:hypothetical protein P154DRAFT_558485 [Amniculicola lignicola CBS 123094]
MSGTEKLRVAKSLATDLGSLYVQVVVGAAEHERVFYISEKLLCARSAFFRKALSEDWKEGQDKLVKLEEEDPEIFALYEYLSHHNKVPVLGSSKYRPETFEVDYRAEELLTAKLYILCEFLGDVISKNLLVDAMMEGLNETFLFPWPKTISMIYDGTSEHNLMRKLLQDFYILNAAPGWFVDMVVDEFPKEFLFAVCVGLVNKSYLSRSLPLKNDSQYYEKVEGESLNIGQSSNTEKRKKKAVRNE